MKANKIHSTIATLLAVRQYDPVTMRWDRMDPLCEKYYAISPYAYCMNNPMNVVDPDGRDWYQNNKTKYYTWFDNMQDKIDGYTHIGGKESLLGEFEPIIDNILTNNFKIESLYSDGFTLDIAPNDKGAIEGSQERDNGFLDEFIHGSGPEFSVLLSDHPYTKEMMSDDGVKMAQQLIKEGNTDKKGQITNYPVSWGIIDYLTTPSLAKQFIGSYSFDAYTSRDGWYLNNVISDSKSVRSLFYHMMPHNHRRSEKKQMGNTYQFYIWKSLK